MDIQSNKNGTLKKGDKVITASTMFGTIPTNLTGIITDICGAYVEINKSVVVHHSTVKHI